MGRRERRDTAVTANRVAGVEPLESRLFLTTGELVRNGAFEGTVATADWVRGSAWQAGALGHSNYHGGAGYAFNGSGSGGYLHNTSGVAGEMYQELTIPAGTVSPTLQFWTKITSEEAGATTAIDTMAVQVKSTSGAVLATLKTLSNLDAGSTAGPYTASGRYHLHTFSLSAYTGQTIRIAFKVTTDGARGTMFRVDDVSLAPPVPVVPGTSGQIVGYLPDYRYSLFSRMDLNYVTHVNYFSVGFASNGALNAPTATFNSHLDTVVAAAHARGVGVSITTGPGQPYAAMGASATARARLVSDLKTYVLAHNLDGVDIDWEPPARGADQINYGLLIDDLYAAFNPIGKKITAAVNPWTKEIPVDATKKMSWVNVMCYDFHYANNSTYEAATDGMLQWEYYGVAKDKLVMGTPFYGRSGTSWSDTTSKTYGNFFNEYVALHGQPPSPDSDVFVDANGKTWYVNNITTIQRKMAWVRDNGYGGAMIWELGQDHWNAANQYDQYSLLPVINSMLRPPAWLSPAAGSRFNFVAGKFIHSFGTVTFIGNANTSVEIRGGATAILDATQKWSSLSIAAGGTLDVGDEALVINYSGASPLGSRSGSTYTGLTGLIQSGFKSGEWNGSGIITSMSDAESGLTTVGIAEASAVFPGAASSLWRGQSVDGTSVLIAYTYAGDANLDGFISGDDYSAIDYAFGIGGASHYFNGDFNYDGVITGDDYAVIDFNLIAQGGPLAGGAAATTAAPRATLTEAWFAATPTRSTWSEPDRPPDDEPLL